MSEWGARDGVTVGCRLVACFFSYVLKLPSYVTLHGP